MTGDSEQNTMKRKDKTSKYSKTKFLITFCSIMAILAVIRHAFSIDIPTPEKKEVPTISLIEDDIFWETDEESAEQEIDYAETDSASMEVAKLFEEKEEEENLQEDSVLTDDEYSTEDNDEENAEDEPTDTNYVSKPIRSFDYSKEEEQALMTQLGIQTTDSLDLFFPEKYNRISHVYSYSECFPDINPVQLKAAIYNGITPVSSREEAQAYIQNGELVNIANSPYYAIDRLTHSIPYLVPKCQQLLNTICVNFLDSLNSRGLPPHIPIVTSVLRTSSDISKLQKGNVNATTNSCHCYGTTVDITYNRFYPVTGNYVSSRKNVARYNERMKKILAQVLIDLRMQGKCYVKHERMQACFHLTVR